MRSSIHTASFHTCSFLLLGVLFTAAYAADSPPAVVQQRCSPDLRAAGLCPPPVKPGEETKQASPTQSQADILNSLNPADYDKVMRVLTRPPASPAKPVPPEWVARELEHVKANATISLKNRGGTIYRLDDKSRFRIYLV